MAKLAYLMTGIALATSLPATAVLARDVSTMRVEFADLDLRHDADVEELDDRLRRTISRICGGPPRGGAMEVMISSRCRAQTLADVSPARDQVIRLARAGQPVKLTRLEVKAARAAN